MFILIVIYTFSHSGDPVELRGIPRESPYPIVAQPASSTLLKSLRDMFGHYGLGVNRVKIILIILLNILLLFWMINF